jgi:septal ring factor EnvC (AmiA/AmiB activator)
MSCNLGRKSHCIERYNTHVKLVNKIADVNSLLDNSTQQKKKLKAQLNEPTEKKKEASKSPQKIQAPSNRFNTPIPKILELLIDTTSESSPATPNEFISASTITLADQISNVQLED